MKNVVTLETNNIEKDEDDSVQAESSPLENSLRLLDLITKTLRFYSLIIIAGTLFNVIFLIINFTIYFKESSYRSKYDNSLFLTDDSRIFMMSINVFIFFSGIGVFAVLYLYESRRKYGDVLFEEISDELEWHIDNSIPEKKSSKSKISERPQIDARIILRSFAKSTDLPFFPGKFGPAFYFVINLILMVLSAIVIAKSI